MKILSSTAPCLTENPLIGLSDLFSPKFNGVIVINLCKII